MSVISFQICLWFHFMGYDIFESALERKQQPLRLLLVRGIDPHKSLPDTDCLAIATQGLAHEQLFLRALRNPPSLCPQSVTARVSVGSPPTLCYEPVLPTHLPPDPRSSKAPTHQTHEVPAKYRCHCNTELQARLTATQSRGS